MKRATPVLPLAPFESARGHELAIRRTGRRRHELGDGERVYGRLQRARVFGTLAQASTTAGEYTFKRVGFLRARVTVRLAEATEDLAVFEPRWNGEGRLAFAGGRTWAWEKEGFWRATWRLEDDTHRTLFTIRHLGWTGRRGVVTLAPHARKVPEAALLILLAWYLMRLMSEDTAVAAAAG